MHNLKFDHSYFIDKLSKWKNLKFIHKFPSIMYKIFMCVYVCM